MKKEKKVSVNLINRKAKHDYHFEKMIVAGIQLEGTEVKAIKDSRVSFVDSYCVITNGEIFVKGLNISAPATAYSHTPLRDRKLLIKKQEIHKWEKELIVGYTIIPYRIFENDRGLLKIEIALAKGKKLYDKRETIKSRDIERDVAKELKR